MHKKPSGFGPQKEFKKSFLKIALKKTDFKKNKSKKRQFYLRSAARFLNAQQLCLLVSQKTLR